LRLRMVLSYTAGGHAPVLMPRYCLRRESGQRVLDSRRGVCTIRQRTRAIALRVVMETQCSSSNWTKVLTRSPPSNFNGIITKPVCAVSYTTLVTTKRYPASRVNRQHAYTVCICIDERLLLWLSSSFAVTIIPAVFEDVLCPHHEAPWSHGIKEETKTSLRKSCYHQQRQAPWLNNPRWTVRGERCVCILLRCLVF